MQSQLDLTIVSGVDGDTYRRLLALCKCVALPFMGENVLLSVVDALASGTALVTPRHPGAARLESEQAPIAFYGAAAGTSAKIVNTGPSRMDAPERHQRARELHSQVEALLTAPERLASTREASIAFSKDHLDIYRILERILKEQVLT
jgi:glycosyltransferase involved in cell wall biosynthesis